MPSAFSGKRKTGHRADGRFNVYECLGYFFLAVLFLAVEAFFVEAAFFAGAFFLAIRSTSLFHVAGNAR
jgi:hypothetical protein